MQKLLIGLFLVILFGCGSSSSSTTTEPLDLSGTFGGTDNLTNTAEVTMDGSNVTILLKTLPEDTIITGTILASVASSGKKGKQETNDVDLQIDTSNISVFEVGKTSFGRIVNTDNLTVEFQFNFTDNQTRPTADIKSDWSMDGTKIPEIIPQP